MAASPRAGSGAASTQASPARARARRRAAARRTHYKSSCSVVHLAEKAAQFTLHTITPQQNHSARSHLLVHTSWEFLISDLGSRISDLVGVKSRCDGLQQPYSKKGMVDLRLSSARSSLMVKRAPNVATCSAISRPKIRRYPPPESPGSPCRARPCATC